MSMFTNMLQKLIEADKLARSSAKIELLKKHGLIESDLSFGGWELREEGPSGHTTVSLWKKMDYLEVKTESTVRTSIKNPNV